MAEEAQRYGCTGIEGVPQSTPLPHATSTSSAYSISIITIIKDVTTTVEAAMGPEYSRLTCENLPMHGSDRRATAYAFRPSASEGAELRERVTQLKDTDWTNSTNRKLPCWIKYARDRSKCHLGIYISNQDVISRLCVKLLAYERWELDVGSRSTRDSWTSAHKDIAALEHSLP
jgi:hypothetical protein